MKSRSSSARSTSASGAAIVWSMRKSIAPRLLDSTERTRSPTLSPVTKIADVLATGRSYSFEFFPPRNAEMEETLRTTLVELEPLGPSYVSVTYGAGGTTRERTHEIVVDILQNTAMTPMAHLTCAAHTRDELAEVITRYGEAGIENILALGGDPPADLDLPPGELHYASELVELVRELGDFSVGVAAHPEPPPEVGEPRHRSLLDGEEAASRPTSPSRSSSSRRRTTSISSRACTRTACTSRCSRGSCR